MQCYPNITKIDAILYIAKARRINPKFNVLLIVIQQELKMLVVSSRICVAQPVGYSRTQIYQTC